MRSFYEILGVEENSSQEEIKIAYHDLLRKSHPDKGNDQAEATIQLVAVIGKTLRDKTNRDNYDRWLREQRLRAARGTIVESIEVRQEEIHHLVEYCRCGDEYDIDREQLLQVVDIGVFECPSCSLCLQVLRKTE
ncbi:hypothetical protein PMAYCL1PPCAC_18184 [Pristionchus mayeri]|uniref:Uncharacterized protein n=1 Tax=Pristionchus mayeri TaxID=1317129 RepID=A0AAN5CP38_9BILA|nr:hypothetical protein PMAYCL1PPCAC_18184 [Pristionchus mayeri]